MDCLKIQSQLTAFEEGGLTENEDQKIKDHLQSCPSCKKASTDLVDAWKILEKLPVEESDPFAWKRFLSKLRRKSIRRKMSYVAIAASLIAVIGAGLLFQVSVRGPALNGSVEMTMTSLFSDLTSDVGETNGEISQETLETTDLVDVAFGEMTSLVSDSITINLDKEETP